MAHEEYATIIIVFDDVSPNNIIAGITDRYAFTSAVCDGVPRDGIAARSNEIYAKSVGIDGVLRDSSIVTGRPEEYTIIGIGCYTVTYDGIITRRPKPKVYTICIIGNITWRYSVVIGGNNYATTIIIWNNTIMNCIIGRKEPDATG